MAIFILWIVFSIIVGIVASSRKAKIGGGAAFFLSLILSPVIGFLIAILSKPDENKVVASGGIKKCPQCAELIKKEALICRFCNHKFEKEKVITEVPKEPIKVVKADRIPKHFMWYLAIGFVVLFIIGAILKHFYPN